MRVWESEKNASYTGWHFMSTTLHSPWSIGAPALTKPHFSQSWGMMFTGPGQHGHEADGSEFEGCCWCYDGGEYTCEARMNETNLDSVRGFCHLR